MAKNKIDPPKKSPVIIVKATTRKDSTASYKKPEGKLQDSLVRLVNRSEPARKAYVSGMVGNKDSVSSEGKKYATKDLRNAMSDSRTFTRVPKPATKGYEVTQDGYKRGFRGVAPTKEVLPRLAGDTTTTKKITIVKKKK